MKVLGKSVACVVEGCIHPRRRNSELCLVHYDFVRSQLTEKEWDRTYVTWCQLKERVKFENASICKEWSYFVKFLTDMGPKPGSYHQIKLNDGAKIYSKNNCHWVEFDPHINKRRPKLSFKIAEQIREEALDPEITQASLAKKYGVSAGSIYRIVNHEVWRDNGNN